MKTAHTHNNAFTLVELLVTIAVVGILAAITISAVGRVKESAYKASDLSAARQIMSAYLTVPQDNDGRLLPSVLSEDDELSMKILDHNGDPILAAEVKNRYVFRLLPYAGGIDLFYPGRSQTHLSEIRDINPYYTSYFPSFGMNSEYTGGDYRIMSGRHRVSRDPTYAVLTLAQSTCPSEHIVFVSTHSDLDDADTDAEYAGYFDVKPPTQWSGSYNEDRPSRMGNVHLRYDNKAIVAHLDGSVDMLTEDELKDMRRWSNVARNTNNPDYNAR
ncbi:type II secretion system protein [Cerasicoccus frondis]|uniref:type II secretion system protein n=1 Tax=Cerasicoccus frondis TaxID=490090 RepID=UPI002852C131|nr:type II secretion system protein [Cerasicoccus frondis]